MRRPYPKYVGISVVAILACAVFFASAVWAVSLLPGTPYKDAAAIVQAVAVSVAACLGGGFAAYKLGVFRTFEPHLTISHEVRHRRVGDVYIHIDVIATLRNTSQVKIELREADFSLQQVAPLPSEAVERLYEEVFVDRTQTYPQWPILDEVERIWGSGELIIEPGESHQETYEFIALSHIESVLIDTYFRNPRWSKSSDSAEGWGAATVYDTIIH